MTFDQTRTDGRTAIFEAPAAAAKIEKQITSGWPPVKKNWLRTPGCPALRLAGCPALRLAGHPKGRTKKKRKNQSVSQTIDQVMAINSVQK